MGFGDSIIPIIGIIIAIVIVSGVTLPAIYTPTVPSTKQAANLTFATDINSTNQVLRNLTITSALTTSAAYPGTLQLGWNQFSYNCTLENLTIRINNNLVGNVHTCTSNSGLMNFTVPVSYLQFGDNVVVFNTTDPTSVSYNTSGMILTYSSTSTFSNVNSGVVIMWTVVLAIVVIVGLMFFVMREMGV